MKKWLTETDVRALAAALYRGRTAFSCPAPRVDAAGQTGYRVERPGRNPDRNEKEVSYGTHGAAYLVVNPETGEVACGACNGTVTPPPVQSKAR